MAPQSLTGTLTTIDVGPFKYPIFTSGDLSSERAVLFVGGLTNGLAAVPFSYALSEALGKAGWKFVQFHWSSAYAGYGTGSLDRDRDEMELVVKHLRGAGLKTIVLAGHSTGSQNVIHYLSNARFAEPSPDGESASLKVEGGIMQAPASDREFMEKLEAQDWFDQLPEAERLIAQGKGDTLLSREFCKKAGFGGVELKIDAYRLWSLIGKGGDDDYFSDDIPSSPTDGFAHSLSSSFGRLSAPVLALYSDGDAAYQHGDIPTKLERWKAAAKGKLEYKLLDKASHDVSEPEAQVVLCDTVLGWLKRFD